MSKLHLAQGAWLSNFIGYAQRMCIKELVMGEEGDVISSQVIRLAEIIQAMPKTYETTTIEMADKVVHLHYFGKGVDAWIVERDVDDTLEGLGLGQQIQAYGKISLQGEGWDGGEWGYIDIATLIRLGIEIDLYWEPKTVREILT